MLETKYQICLMANGDHNISKKYLVKNCLWPVFKLDGGIEKNQTFRSLDEIGI